MTYDISIIMPAIRTHKWDAMYDSIVKSCKKHTFELVLCGPFELTEKLSKLDNVKHIKDYGSPSRCANIAAINASSTLIAHSVDDALFVEDALDQALEQYEALCGKKDVINLRYVEGTDHKPTPGNSIDTFGENYFSVSGHPIYRLPGIPQHLKIAPHHIIDLEYFKEMGGYDCINFEYQNHNLTDLLLRIQNDGGKVFHTDGIVSYDDWYVGKDHKAIEDAFNGNDHPNFVRMYSDFDCLEKRKNCTSIDDWKRTPPVWNRRFKDKLPKTFQEMNS